VPRALAIIAASCEQPLTSPPGLSISSRIARTARSSSARVKSVAS
jgi:hypothetical protein